MASLRQRNKLFSLPVAPNVSEFPPTAIASKVVIENTTTVMGVRPLRFPRSRSSWCQCLTSIGTCLAEEGGGSCGGGSCGGGGGGVSGGGVSCGGGSCGGGGGGFCGGGTGVGLCTPAITS